MLDLRCYDRTIIHENEERMIPDIEVKMMLGDHSTTKRNPLLAPYFEMIERGQKGGGGGRKDREVESEGEEDAEEVMEIRGKNTKHKGKHEPRVTNFFIKNNMSLLFLQFPFYRINGEVTGKRHLATLVPRRLTFVQREDETNEIIF